MGLKMIIAIALLLVWALITFVVNDAPGLTHSLLIAGVSLLIWGVVDRDKPDGSVPPS